MYCMQAHGHVAFYSLGNDGGDKLVEDVVHFFHVHLHHEAGFLPLLHLHHVCHCLGLRLVQCSANQCLQPKCTSQVVTAGGTTLNIKALGCWHMTSA